MLGSLLYVSLAILAFALIIFLHEMGHLLAALWAGIEVETFSIGFGRPIVKWKAWGIQWQLGWMPLGGYIRIVGMGDGKEDSPGSYASAKPWKRMVVVAMGPIVNLLLAWALFAAIWIGGGQLKPFSEVNGLVGWIDPSSEMATQIHPGDRILSYDGAAVQNGKDHLYAPMLASGPVQVHYELIDYDTGELTPAMTAFTPYRHPEAADASVKTLGLLSSARVLFINGFSSSSPAEPQKAAAPASLTTSLMQGDRLVAVNGMRVFGDRQLQHLLNDGSVLLTIQRNEKVLQIRLPTYGLMSLALSPSDRLEMGDWHHQFSISKPLLECRWIGYDLDSEARVQGKQQLIDPQDRERLTDGMAASSRLALQRGDRILAVAGKPIQQPQELFNCLQTPHAVVWIERDPSSSQPMKGEQAQSWLINSMSSVELKQLLKEPIQEQARQVGSYVCLPYLPLASRESVAGEEIAAWRAQIKQLVDERQRQRLTQLMDEKAQELVLGIQLKELVVFDNPTPNEQFGQGFSQICRTLNSLITGNLNPKWLAGPVGTVTIMAQGFSMGMAQALQWMAIISLNLGIFNLLPLPILDGGRLVIDGMEALTGKKLNPKILDALSYLLVGVLVVVALTATYWDFWRLWSLWR